MKPVYQTKFGQGNGNCFQAAVASILELELDDVPDFCNLYSDDEWFNEFQKWLNKHFNAWCLAVNYKSIKNLPEYHPPGYVIMVGDSVRVHHAVVYKGKELVHDPCKGGGGLVKIDDMFMIIPNDPIIVLGWQ